MHRHGDRQGDGRWMRNRIVHEAPRTRPGHSAQPALTSGRRPNEPPQRGHVVLGHDRSTARPPALSQEVGQTRHWAAVEGRTQEGALVVAGAGLNLRPPGYELSLIHISEPTR